MEPEKIKVKKEAGSSWLVDYSSNEDVLEKEREQEELVKQEKEEDPKNVTMKKYFVPHATDDEPRQRFEVVDEDYLKNETKQIVDKPEPEVYVVDSIKNEMEKRKAKQREFEKKIRHFKKYNIRKI